MTSEPFSTLERSFRRLVERLQQDYGPRRRNCHPHRWGPPEDLALPSKATEQLAELYRRVDDTAGDGRFTALLLAGTTVAAVLQAGVGRPASAVAKAIRRAAGEVAERVNAFGKPPSSADEVTRVATTAALGRVDLGQAMMEAFRGAGKDGIVSVVREPHRARTIRLTFLEGSHFPLRGRSGRMTRVALDAPLLLVSLTPLGEGVLKRLLTICRQADRPCLCLAPDMSPRALALARRQATPSSQTLVPFLPPAGSRWPDLFRDLAVLTGARLFEEKFPPSEAELALGDLGEAERIDLQEDRLIIHRGGGDLATIEDHADWLLAELDHVGSQEEREWLNCRRALVAGRFAELYVGGDSEIETDQLYELACSSLHATQALIASRAVPGGGAA